MASYAFEVEVEIEATMRRGDESVGEFGSAIDDLDLSSVSMLVSERKMSGIKYRNIDLLDGLDKAAREQVIKNILAAYGDEIEEAAYEDA
jgi:hypothetical protein